ncbi:MAG: putative spermidine/putrescine transport system substrate-binding protein [Streptosporangiaceae bacterium]|nr:putative spermidine/putrescine transport system substrate-binding protein [Streptosporangiaceae bacterium]
MKSPYRFTVMGVTALALLATGCSASSSSGSSGGTNWATVTSVSAGGGMSKLIAAAKKEGKLNVIALPPTWANYGTIIKDFKAKYGITVNSQNPTGSSQDEVNAVKSENGTAKAPDVLDVGMAVALVSTSLFAPYKVSTWSQIPATQKDSAALWYQDYGGYMSIGYNSAKFGTITSVSQLLGPKFKNAVALNGNPTAANAALSGVMMANLAQGGTANSIAKGVNFFHSLKQAGNFVPVQATNATIKAGTTPVVINWDYLNTASVVGQGANWKVFVPSNATLGGYYAQAINKNAPDPAAARLWEEFLYSQAASGGQNLWLQGGARPVEQAAMTSNGLLDKAAAASLPPVAGTPVFLTGTQATGAATYLASNWAQAVK